MSFLPRLSINRRYHTESLELDCFLTADNRLVESDDDSFVSYFDDKGHYKGADEFGIEPIFTEESITASDMAVMLIAAGEMFHDNRPVELAENWMECGFTAETAWPWCDIGCWDAATAAIWRDAGLTPEQVKSAAESMVDGCSEPDLEWTDSCPIYSCCNDDTDPQDVIDEVLGE